MVRAATSRRPIGLALSQVPAEVLGLSSAEKSDRAHARADPYDARSRYAGSRPARACSVQTLRQNADHVYTRDQIGAFVDSATVIVRAVADRAYGPGRGGGDFLHPSLPVEGPIISFTVREWIRGEPDKKPLRADGYFMDVDDFNPRPTPYPMVRRAGQHGDCYAKEYRRGAEYLLIMRKTRRGLTPYWMPLAPSNEQIRGDNDPWLLWVRDRVRTRGR